MDTLTVPSKGKNFSFLGLVLGVLVAGVLIALFFHFKGDTAKKLLSPFTKKTEVLKEVDNRVQNPITGELVAPEVAEKWKDQRPMGVMINNYIDARPQSGLVKADIVYEIVAEGGITRFLAFFLSENPDKIGPVRSTREYYLVLAKELGDAMIMHIGWSPQALVAIETWPVRSLARGGASFWRDQDRLNRGIATEHTAYVNGSDLRQRGRDLGWEGVGNFDVWKFKDDSPAPAGEVISNIAVDFWYKGDYSGIFKYNPQNNSYLRYSGYDAFGNPVPLKDQETGEQVEVKDVIVQFVAEEPIDGDEKNRLSYQLVGSGSGLVFLDGRVTQVTWTKEERDARTKFYDTNGNEVQFNRGRIWVCIVPDRNVDQVVYN